MGLALIVIIGGIVIIAWLYFWSRQRDGLGSIVDIDQLLSGAPQTAKGEAVLVATEHGQIIYVNEKAQSWLEIPGGNPSLEEIARLVQPAENFFSLFSGEAKSSFQVRNRWVEAASYYIPAEDGVRLIIRLHELGGSTSELDVLDLGQAMAIIEEIDETINVSMGIEQVLQTLLTILSKATAALAGEIALWDEEQKVLVQRGWVGDASYLLSMTGDQGIYNPGDGLAGWVARKRTPMLIKNSKDLVAIHEKLLDGPFRSVVAVPLILGERFIGTFQLFHVERDQFTPVHLALLQAVSSPAAVAIYNAELYAEQTRRIDDIASVQAIGEQSTDLSESGPVYLTLNERIAGLLSADMCGVLLHNEDRNGLVAQPPFFGLPDHVTRNIFLALSPDTPLWDIWKNEPHWVSNDVSEEVLLRSLGLRPLIETAGIHNMALIPVQIGGRRIGMLMISNKQTEGGFTGRDLQNLRVLAAQAAIVVENIRLFEREYRLDTELVGLQEISHAIGALSHEGEFYSEITERIARQMDIAICGILLYDERQQALVSQLPFYGVDEALIADYRIDLSPGSIVHDLWTDEDYWYTNNVQSDPLVFEAKLDELASQIGVKQTLMAVLSAGGRRLGVVQVSNKLKAGEDFSDNDARLLLVFATQAAAIIENARLYRQVQASADQAEGLRRLAELASSVLTTEETFAPVLSEIAHLTNSGVVFINVLDQLINSMITYPRWVYGFELNEPVVQDMGSEEFSDRVALTHQPLISNDVRNDSAILPGYRSMAERYNIDQTIIVPLTIGDRNLGELGIANRSDRLYSEDDIEILMAVAAQVAIVIDRLLLYEATGQNLERRVEELDAISRVSNELAVTLDMDQVLAVICQETARAANADASTIVLLRPSNEWASADRPELSQRIDEIPGLVGLADIELEAVRRGAESMIISDYEQSEMNAMPAGIRSGMATAILYADQIVGVIYLYHAEPNRFDDRGAAFLMTMATKASLAYASSIRYREQLQRGENLRRRVEQLNQIFELGQVLQSNTDPVTVLEAIAYSVQQSVGFDSVVMTLVDEEEGVLRRVAQAGLPIDAFQKSQAKTLPLDHVSSLFSESYRVSESYFYPLEEASSWINDSLEVVSTSYEGNRSIMASRKQDWHDGDMLLVKLSGSGGNLLGVMSLDRPHNNRRPDQTTLELLEIFVHQASSNIENSRLFLSSLRTAEHEARLNDLGEAIAATLDVAEIVQAVAHGVLRLMPLSQVIVALLDTEQQGYDVYRVEVGDLGILEPDHEHRPDLDGTAMGRSLGEQQGYLYHSWDDQVQEYDDLRTWYNNGEQSSLILPLVTGGERLGVIHLGSRESSGRGFNEFLALLRRIAQMVAGAIQNASLFNQAVNLRVLNESVVESIQQGIVVLDNSGRIISANDFMSQRYDWDKDALRQDLFAYRPELSEFLADDVGEVLKNGVPKERIRQFVAYSNGIEVMNNFYTYPLRSGETIRGAVLLVEDVSERTRLEQAIEARANQLAALTEVSSRITASLERSEVVEMALDEMSRIIDFDTMTLWRRSGSFMVLEGARGLDDKGDDLVAQGFRIRYDEHERIQELFSSQRAFAISRADGLDALLPGEEEAKSWLGVPLVSQAHVVGMIILVKYEPDFYETTAEQHVAFAFASQVAVAMANAELFEQTFERTNELGTLLEAAQATSLTLDLDQVFRTVVELMFSALDMDDCAIMIWYEVENELEVQVDINRYGDQDRITPKGTRIDLAENPAKLHALQTRDIVVVLSIDETTPYTRELEELREQGDWARMLVPLVVRDQSFGLIQLEKQAEEREFAQQKVRMARALGAQVAIAIDNARLTTETSARFAELLVINELSQSISSTLDLDDMIRVVRNQVPTVTGAEETYLALLNSETETITFPMAVKNGADHSVPSRQFNTDEVSFIIRNRRSLNLGADVYSLDDIRSSMGISNGEGDAKSYLGVPLIVGDQVLGVLAIKDSQRTRAFGLNEERILSTVASQLGAAIQNARLFEQTRNFADDLNKLVEERTVELEEERDRIDTLYQITSELARTLDMDRLLGRALGMVAKAVGADEGAIIGIDPLTDRLYSQAVLNPGVLVGGEDGGRPAHPAESIANWLIDNEHAVIIDDLHEVDYWDREIPGAEQWRSALAVVLENNEDIQGVMVMLRRETGAFGEGELRLVVAAASQAASAMNNADLYQLIRDQAERLGTLLRLEQEESEKSTAILEGIADGVMLADAEGNIRLFNTAAERILGLPRDKVMDQSLSELIGLFGGSAAAWVRAVEEWTIDQYTEQPGEYVDERLDLADRVVSVHLSPVYIGEQLLGTVSVFRDITRDVEVDRMKAGFVSNVSHEFRTPLTPIKGYTDLLMMGAAGEISEAQQEILSTIKSNVDRLALLVEDVLDISKIDAGEEKLSLASFEIADVLTEILERQASQPDNLRKNITTSLDCEEDLPLIEADREKLKKVLGNIIDNAFNYTREGGSIMVRIVALHERQNIRIAIQDTGIGIPEEFRESVWGRFQRHDKTALSMDVAGTGLGMAIVKELVEMHHGQVWFDSEVEKGTTFYVLLPVEQPHFITGEWEALQVKAEE